MMRGYPLFHHDSICRICMNMSNIVTTAIRGRVYSRFSSSKLHFAVDCAFIIYRMSEMHHSCLPNVPRYSNLRAFATYLSDKHSDIKSNKEYLVQQLNYLGVHLCGIFKFTCGQDSIKEVECSHAVCCIWESVCKNSTCDACLYVGACVDFMRIFGNLYIDGEFLLGAKEEKLICAIMEDIIDEGLVNNFLPEITGLSHSNGSTMDIFFLRRQCLLLVAAYFVQSFNNAHMDAFWRNCCRKDYFHLVYSALLQLVYTPWDDKYTVYKQQFLQQKNSSRDIYKNFIKYAENLHPRVILKNLMLMSNVKAGAPNWYTQKLNMRQNYLLSMSNGLKYLFEIGYCDMKDTPNFAKYLNVAANIVSHLLSSQQSPHFIIQQIIDFVKTPVSETEEDSSARHLRQFGRMILKKTTESSCFEKSFLEPVAKPLMQDYFVYEDVKKSMADLLPCFITEKDLFSLPANSLKHIVFRLFWIYCEYLWHDCGQLVLRFLHGLDSDEEKFAALDTLVFNDPYPGVQFVHSFKKCSIVRQEEKARLLQKLATNNDFHMLFTYCLSKISSDKRPDRMAIYAFLLEDLTCEPYAVAILLKKPEPILHFAAGIIEKDESQILRTCLVLCMFLAKEITCDVNPDLWKTLVEAVAKLKTRVGYDAELKILAQDAYKVFLSKCAGENATDPEDNKSPFQAAWKDCTDALLPVRAHALQDLVRLIKEGDVETLAKREALYVIFRENLREEDSYVYLRGMEGIVALTLCKRDQLLPVLFDEFASSEDEVVKMKIGEVLVRVSKSIGFLSPKHRSQMLNTFIIGASDDSANVRASSLANLAEAAEYFKYNIGECISEMMRCAKCVISFDDENAPRRAAASMLAKLFEALSVDMFKILDSSVKEIYDWILQCANQDADDAVKVHLQEALHFINENTKKFLAPQPTFQRKIHILDPIP